LPYVLVAYRNLYHPTVKDVPFFLLYGYEPILPHQPHDLPPHLNQSLAEEERTVVCKRLNEARAFAAHTVANVQKHMKERHDANKKAPPQYNVGDLVFTIKPQLAPGGTVMKLARIYDGPYRYDQHLPGSRTMRLIRMRSRNNPGGEVRLAHVDNVKPFRPSLATRPDTIYEVVPPVLSSQVENRVINFLERAASQAQATIGAPRSRAIIAHALGPQGVAPLPTTHPALPPPVGSLQYPNDAPMDLSHTIPTTAPITPPPQVQVPLAHSWTKDDRPWHMTGSTSTAPPTGFTRSGRITRRPDPVCRSHRRR